MKGFKMMHRILLSLLSISMVANCIQAAQDEQLPHFQFRKGISFNEQDTTRFRPLFWPKWMSQNMCTPQESKKAAFIQRLQEISHESRTAAKEGLFTGFIGGALAGAIIGSFKDFIHSKHLPGNGRPDNSKNLNYYIGRVIHRGLQIVAGATAGAIAGGTVGAAIAVPKKVHTSLSTSGYYSGEYLHEWYC